MENVIDQVISHESLIRRKWLTIDQAAEEIVAFEDRFGKEHFELACHAALPLILTPELINLIRVNYFDREEFPWIAEQDFLLSSLCRPVGDGLFEVEPRVREVLLAQLEEDFGRYRLRDLAEFLLAYTESPLGGHHRVEINQLIRWIALAYVAPETLVQELTENLHASVSPQWVGPLTLSSHIKIATAYELVADALERSLPREEYQGLASDSRLMAYYWYGDRARLKQHLVEGDEHRQEAGPDEAAKPPTVFLDWVKQSPAHLPPTQSDELPLALARSEWGRFEEERFELSRIKLQTIADDVADSPMINSVLAVKGAPGPARTEFVRLLAQILRPGTRGRQLYLDLEKGYRSREDVTNVQAEVISGISPNLEFTLDEAIVRDLYASVLSEQSTLIVLDNLPAVDIDALRPPLKSLLVVTSRTFDAGTSAHVIDLDHGPEGEEGSGFSLADKIFLQDQLLFLMENQADRERLLDLLPQEMRKENPLDAPRFVFASQLIDNLLTRHLQGVTRLFDILIDRGAPREVETRLRELQQRISRVEIVEKVPREHPQLGWPKAPSPFVDRTWEVETIRRRLLGEDKRKIIVIEGAAGIGKTALVMKVLDDPELQRAFPGGVIWLDDRSIHPGLQSVVESIADSLGHDILPEGPDLEPNARSILRVSRILSERRAIVVFDEIPEDQRNVIFSFDFPAVIHITREPLMSLSSLAIAYNRYILEPLPIEAAVELVQRLAPDAAQFFPQLERIIAASGNNSPHQLQRLTEILKDYSHEEAEKHLQSLLSSSEKPVREGLFISYSHQDRKWLERLQTSLRPYTRSYQVSVWDDTKIKPGSKWKDELEKALASAKVAVLLVSPHFLASDLIANYELPLLLEAAKKEGLQILWVATSPSLYKQTELVAYQAVNDPSKPLSGFKRPHLDRALVNISERIGEALRAGRDERKNELYDLDNRASTNLVTVDVIKLLSDLITQRKRSIGPQIIWRLDHSDAPVYVRGNPDVLRELFSQVIDNAVQAVKGISKPRVNISTRLKDDKIGISIADNGPGIAPDARHLIFEPFTSLREQSPGLGLFIAAHIAQLYGGSINLESVHRPGATFVVNLPVEPMAGNQSVILVVDDEMALLESLRRLLKPQGYDVITANDADTARVILERTPVDLAILDIRLGPGQPSGLELAREELFRKVPVIFFSAMLDPATATKAWELQPDGLPLAVDVVEKGRSSERLLHSIEKALQQRHLTRNTKAETEFYSCFISFSSGDEDFARKLYTRMKQEGVRVWFAPEDIQLGVRINDQIEGAIQRYDKVLLILSENSMRSEWVATEIRKARAAETRLNRRKLYPVRLVDFDAIRSWEVLDAESGRDLAVELREYFIPDFSNWKNDWAFEAAFGVLLRDIRASEPSITEREKINEQSEYDVFLCYNRSDRAAVEHVAKELLQRGIRPWFDVWSLSPGVHWQKAIEQEIEGMKTAVVFIGESGVGAWAQSELAAILKEFLKEGRRIIPVILPTVEKIPKLPKFMRNLTWLDFRQNRPDAIDGLIRGIREESPAPARQLEES